MKRLLTIAAIVLAAIAIFVTLTLPPARRDLRVFSDGTVRGVLHVHTNRSDGLGTPDEIAAAAARAGLKFVVFADHGDATRKPLPPEYRSGVLCLDGEEISTSAGHYVIVGFPSDLPYPLGGDSRDVIEDAGRFGGFGIAAHPDSPKPDLRWREWTAPFDGIELLNLDTGWRIEAQARGAAPKWRLFTTLVDYPFRSPEVIAGLIHPSGVLSNWEALTRRRRVVTLAGADAHARLDLGRVTLPVPGYESAFRVMSVRIEPEHPLSGDAAADAAVVLNALRAGHLFTAVDAVAAPPAFEFSATNGNGTAREGDEIAAGGPLQLHVRSNAPADFTTIVRDGLRVLASTRDTADNFVHVPAGPGVFWVEIAAPNGTTWIRSNPIYVRESLTRVPPAQRQPATRSTPMFEGAVAATAAGWRVEHDATSLIALDFTRRVNGSTLRVRYGFDDSPYGGGQFAALVYDTPAGLLGFDRLTLTGRGEHPMRVSVQLRTDDGRRWQRSTHLDVANQENTVYFDEMLPIGVTPTFKPPLERVRSIMFVLDRGNTRPSASGRWWIDSADLEGRK
jgi:hypothetical protein